MVHSTSVRVFLVLTAVLDLECEQSDIVAAYLNALVPAGQKVYVKQPTGFADGTKRVCLLNKALYGLRREPALVYDTITPELRKLGFEPFGSDLCCFRNKDTGVMLLIYVDDLLIAAATKAAIAVVKQHLAGIYELKDLGEVRAFLGLNITRDRTNRVIYINQEDYIHKILAKYGKTGLSPSKTPWPAGATTPKQWEPVDAIEARGYLSETASLNYLAVHTRPDITYTISRLSEAQSNPSREHCDVLKHLWRYIAGTTRLGLTVGGQEYTKVEDLSLHAYGDASFGDDLLTRASTGGHVVFLAGCPIIWKSKKQTIVTISTTEAEFINLTPTAQSLLWVAQICEDAGVRQKKPLLIHTDSQDARLAVLNPLESARTRGIDIRYKWVIHKVQQEELSLQLVKTTEMKADGLTKALKRLQHAAFVKQLGLAQPPTKQRN